MKLVIVLRVLAGLSLIAALILFILHFTSQYDLFWFSSAVACSSVFNLIAAVKYLKIRKIYKNKEKIDEGEDELSK